MDQNTNHKKEGVIEIPVGKSVEKLRKNPWIISTVVLVVILVVVIFMKSGGNSGAGYSIGENEMSQKASNFINSVLLAGNGSVSVVNVSKSHGLYEVVVSYKGQNVPTYFTADGSQFVQGVVPMDAATANAGAGSASGSSTQPTGPVNISIDNSPTIGNKSAKVTVVEFADFSCPYCEAASGDNADMTAAMKQRDSTWEPLVSNLIKDYVNTGKVLFVSKFAFGHTGGHPAQLVSWCLNDQSSALFWKFYPVVYSHASADTENLTLMESVAKGLGADMNKLQTCLNSTKFDSQFDRDQNEATAAGVQGTPAFFVNGQLVEGAVPYSQIKQMIDAELSN